MLRVSGPVAGPPTGPNVLTLTPELVEIVAAWPALSESVKQAILLLIHAEEE